jgi:F-type H+-transporting ATPase subunit gamma
MAKTQDIKRRIRSVQNTRQLTKAMKMVSAAKLRRAQEAVTAARPYAEQMGDILSSVAGRVTADMSPLLAEREQRRIEVVLLSGDKGLCGSFNSQILKTAQRFLADVGPDVESSLSLVGKRGRDFFRRRHPNCRRTWIDVFRDVNFPLAQEIADDQMDRFIAGDVDAVYLLFNRFKSTMSQVPVVQKLLPIEPPTVEADEGGAIQEYIYEPGAAALLDTLLPQSVQMQVYQALLESCAAEHAARMTAMDSATRNAGELIEKLTLHMNRVRQAAITTEIIEVVSGAAALS